MQRNNGVRPRGATRPVHEISEMRIALGLAAATGICVVPYTASRHRTDLHYRLIDTSTRSLQSSSATGATTNRRGG